MLERVPAAGGSKGLEVPQLSGGWGWEGGGGGGRAGGGV